MDNNDILDSDKDNLSEPLVEDTGHCSENSSNTSVADLAHSTLVIEGEYLENEASSMLLNDNTDVLKTKLVSSCQEEYNLFGCRVYFEGQLQSNPHKQQIVQKKSSSVNQFVSDKSFINKPYLLSHVHNDNPDLKCDVCGKLFKDRKSLRRHCKIHQPKRYECDNNNLELHMQFQSRDRPFLCNLCEKTFLRKSHLNEHQIAHKEQREFPCEICYKSFKAERALRRHSKTHVEKNIESKVFNKKSLDIHLYSHSGGRDRPFSCNLCEKTFLRKSHLNEHQFAHTEQRDFSCELCYKSFKAERALRRHLKTHVEKNIESKVFNKKSLDIHLHSHSGGRDRPFSCKLCLKTFLRKSHLNEHQIAHKVQKDFHCEVCYKSFKAERALRRHLKTHVERNIECEVCNKKFVSEKSLDIHIQSHSGIRPFICDICEKSFLRKNHLNSHILIHFPDSQANCETCGKTFSGLRSLRRHTQIHAKDKLNNLVIVC